MSNTSPKLPALLHAVILTIRNTLGLVSAYAAVSKVPGQRVISDDAFHRHQKYEKAVFAGVLWA